MDLKDQLSTLIEDAPKYGVDSTVIEQAIIPVFLGVINNLDHETYYLLQNPQQDWLISVLTHKRQPQLSKKVIFAYASLKQAQKQLQNNQNLEIVALPVIELLWRFFSVQQLDSLIFQAEGNSQSPTIEIKRQTLQQQIQQKIRSLKSVPPNLA